MSLRKRGRRRPPPRRAEPLSLRGAGERPLDRDRRGGFEDRQEDLRRPRAGAALALRVPEALRLAVEGPEGPDVADLSLRPAPADERVRGDAGEREKEIPRRVLRVGPAERLPPDLEEAGTKAGADEVPPGAQEAREDAAGRRRRGRSGPGRKRRRDEDGDGDRKKRKGPRFSGALARVSARSPSTG